MVSVRLAKGDYFYESDFGAEDLQGKIDWQKALKDLKEYGDPDLPLYALKEGDYVVIEK